MSPTATPQQRLPHAERRQQLLALAAEMVRSEGTDALTLATLAERAGVTKPITYHHFGTRAGLLMALYEHLAQPQAVRLQAALSRSPRSLPVVAGQLAQAYIDCALASGPEFASIAAALSASQEMGAFHSRFRRAYVDQMWQLLGPCLTLSRARAEPLLLGLLGAADALARAASEGSLGRKSAIAALEAMLLGTLGPAQRA